MATKKTKKAIEAAAETVEEPVEVVEKSEEAVEETTETEKAPEHTFTKSQLVGSKKYSNRKDILNVLLKNDQTYSIAEVDELVEKFMKGKVKK